MSFKNTAGGSTRPLPPIPRPSLRSPANTTNSPGPRSEADQPSPTPGPTDPIPEASNLAHSRSTLRAESDSPALRETDLEFTFELVTLETAVESVFEAPPGSLATSAPQDPLHHQLVQLAQQGQANQGHAQTPPARPTSALPNLPVTVPPLKLQTLAAGTGTDKPVGSPRSTRLSNFKSIKDKAANKSFGKVFTKKSKDESSATPRQDPPRAATVEVPTPMPRQTPTSPRQTPTSPRASASRGRNAIGNTVFRQLNAQTRELQMQFDQHSSNEQAEPLQQSEPQPVPTPRATPTAMGALNFSVDELQRGNQAQDRSINQLMNNMFGEPDAKKPDEKH